MTPVRLLLVPGIVTTLALVACRGPELPPHTIADDSPLAPKNGRRIEVHSSNPGLSKEECVALIEAYRSRAAPRGQVSVCKPSSQLESAMTPWCVENFDGRGITFNDEMFQ